MADREPTGWITVNGIHVPLYEGESKEDSINKAIAKHNEAKRESDISKAKAQADALNGKKQSDIFKRDKWFDKATYDKLPKKMQVQNIVSIGKEKTSDGVRYNASVVWEDGFNRSVSEYGWSDFKDYLKAVLFENRNEQR